MNNPYILKINIDYYCKIGPDFDLFPNKRLLQSLIQNQLTQHPGFQIEYFFGREWAVPKKLKNSAKNEILLVKRKKSLISKKAGGKKLGPWFLEVIEIQQKI